MNTYPDRIVSRVSLHFVGLETGEYVVRAYDQNGKRYREADYFTTDKTDAIQTAHAMVSQRVATSL